MFVQWDTDSLSQGFELEFSSTKEFQSASCPPKNMCGSCCTWLAVWQFIKSYWYDIGDAIAQLIDFGTDINNINVMSTVKPVTNSKLIFQHLMNHFNSTKRKIQMKLNPDQIGVIKWKITWPIYWVEIQTIGQCWTSTFVKDVNVDTFTLPFLPWSFLHSLCWASFWPISGLDNYWTLGKSSSFYFHKSPCQFIHFTWSAEISIKMNCTKLCMHYVLFCTLAKVFRNSSSSKLRKKNDLTKKWGIFY